MAGGERTWDSAPVVVGLELANYAGMLAWALPLAVLSTPAELLAGFAVPILVVASAVVVAAVLVAGRGEARRLGDLAAQPPVIGEVATPAAITRRRIVPLLAANLLLLALVLWIVAGRGGSTLVVAAILPGYVAAAATRRRQQLAWERSAGAQLLLPARYGGSRDSYAWRWRPAGGQGREAGPSVRAR